MANKRSKQGSPSPGAKAVPNVARPGAWLERAAFLLLLAVIAGRPMIQETHSAERSGLLALLGPIGRINPSVTVCLGAAILLACGLLAVAGLRSRRPFRVMGLEWPLLAVAAAALISCSAASNKRVALTAASDWALMLLVAPALFQLLTTHRRARLVVCVILATAATFAVQCVLQRTSEFEETIRLYEQDREQIWQARGVELDSPQVVLFEKRLYAREVAGFGAHANVAGGYLAMCALVGVGLAWSKLYGRHLPLRRGFGVAAAAVTILIGLPVAWTGSKGALAAAGVGVLFIGIVQALKSRRPRPGKALWIGWGVFLAAVLATVGHGLYHGGLPGASLNFRWSYWTNSAGMVGDHWLRGVGMENFGKNYLRYKPITSPEEISDPHNVLVRSAAEWGLPGAAAMLWLLVAGSRAMVRPRCTDFAPQQPEDSARDAPDSTWLVGVLVAAGIVGLRVAAEGFISWPYFLVAACTPATTWLLFYFVLVLDGDRLDCPADDHPGGLCLWLGGAALAFVLHNLVSFSWFVAGVGTTFLALVPVAVFLRNGPMAATDRSAKSAPASASLWRPAAVAVLGICHLVWVLAPVVRTDVLLGKARGAVSSSAGAEQIGPLYERAVAADPLDPAAAEEGARRLAALASESDPEAVSRLDLALGWVDIAQGRDRADAGLRRLEAAVADRRAAASHSAADAERAIRATKEALRRDPANPFLYRLLGDRWCALGLATHAPDAFSEAARAYRKALELDAARPPDELRRFGQRTLDTISEQIDKCLTRQTPTSP